MKQIELKKLKHGTYFKRKPDAKREYIREHYNPRDAYGPAAYWCTRADNIGEGIELRGNTRVFVGC